MVVPDPPTFWELLTTFRVMAPQPQSRKRYSSRGLVQTGIPIFSGYSNQLLGANFTFYPKMWAHNSAICFCSGPILLHFISVCFCGSQTRFNWTWAVRLIQKAFLRNVHCISKFSAQSLGQRKRGVSESPEGPSGALLQSPAFDFFEDFIVTPDSIF